MTTQPQKCQSQSVELSHHQGSFLRSAGCTPVQPQRIFTRIQLRDRPARLPGEKGTVRTK